MKSIIACLGGSQEFLRVRLGIAPEYKLTHGRDYLLSPMRKAQLPWPKRLWTRAAKRFE